MKITAAQAIAACKKIVDDGKAQQKAAAAAVKAAKADLAKASAAFLKEASVLLRSLKPSNLNNVFQNSYHGELTLNVQLADTPENRDIVNAMSDARKPYTAAVERLQEATSATGIIKPAGRTYAGSPAFQIQSRIERAEKALKVLSLLDPSEKVSLGSGDFRFILEGLS